MKTLYTIVFSALLFGVHPVSAQSYFQDFDGDSLEYPPYQQYMYAQIVMDSQNIWQIGAPHKIYFDSAFSRPNAIVTDTTLPYPANNTSVFYFKVPTNGFAYGGFTTQWVQKIDMQKGHAGGIIEISVDSGATWQNVLSDSLHYVYNFYGFNPQNIDTLPSGQVVISGTDNTWRDIWLCINLSFVQHPVDSVWYRFTFVSDSVFSNREGWMMDNFSSHIEIAHPVMEVNKDPLLMVYPQLTYGPVNIRKKTEAADFDIQSADLITETGQMVAHYAAGPGDAVVNVGSEAGGWYFLRVNTTAGNKTYSIWLSKN